jgi:hypothetical protein
LENLGVHRRREIKRNPRVQTTAQRRRDRAGQSRRASFVADAMHTQTSHTNEIAARGGHLLIPVKANQPTLFAHLKTLPWAQIPAGDRTRDRGHGRRETRTVKAVTLATPGGIDFPHAEQAVRITRTRTITTSGKTSPRNLLPHRLPAHRRRAPGRSTGLDRPGMAHRESRPPRPGCHVP